MKTDVEIRNKIEQKLAKLTKYNFYTTPFLRHEKPYYTEILGIREGVNYFLDTVTYPIFKHILSMGVSVNAWASETVEYDEFANNLIFYRYPVYLSNVKYFPACGEYPYEFITGIDYGDGVEYNSFIDNVIYFYITPTKTITKISRFR